MYNNNNQRPQQGGPQKKWTSVQRSQSGMLYVQSSSFSEKPNKSGNGVTYTLYLDQEGLNALLQELGQYAQTPEGCALMVGRTQNQGPRGMFEKGSLSVRAKLPRPQYGQQQGQQQQAYAPQQQQGYPAQPTAPTYPQRQAYAPPQAQAPLAGVTVNVKPPIPYE